MLIQENQSNNSKYTDVVYGILLLYIVACSLSPENHCVQSFHNDTPNDFDDPNPIPNNINSNSSSAMNLTNLYTDHINSTSFLDANLFVFDPTTTTHTTITNIFYTTHNTSTSTIPAICTIYNHLYLLQLYLYLLQHHLYQLSHHLIQMLQLHPHLRLLCHM